jgi:hypothetical protein
MRKDYRWIRARNSDKMQAIATKPWKKANAP